jgi:acyl dehydratase
MDEVIERPTALYLEDLHVGQRFTSGLYHMDESGIKAFAAEFDPQPFHLDEAVAQSSMASRGFPWKQWRSRCRTRLLLS